jgi:hypothetical protein
MPAAIDSRNTLFDAAPDLSRLSPQGRARMEAKRVPHWPAAMSQGSCL